MLSPRELRNLGDRGTSAGDVELLLSGSASTVDGSDSDDETSTSMPMLSGLTVASGGGRTDTRFIGRLAAALIAPRSCSCTRVRVPRDPCRSAVDVRSTRAAERTSLSSRRSAGRKLVYTCHGTVTVVKSLYYMPLVKCCEPRFLSLLGIEQDRTQ